jgi:uncharacterized protein YndB with AHSA1/START domain
MKVLKVILIILIVIFGGFAIWMATLDGKYDVQRSVYIDATPELVYAEVSDFKTWPEWGPWFAKDSTMQAQFGDQTQGEGATYSWTSENQGSGDMKIVAAEPGNSMETKINFGGMGSSNGYWTFTPKMEERKYLGVLKVKCPSFSGLWLPIWMQVWAPILKPD